MQISYTRISTYRECPRKYKFQYIDGLSALPAENIQKGKDLHEKLSDRKIPDFFEKPFRNNFPNPEFEKELNADFLTFELKGFVDVISVSGTLCSIADWKLYKIPESDEQLKIYSLLALYNYDGLEFFNCYFVSLGGKFFKRFQYTREEIKEYEKELIEIVERMAEDKEFVPVYGEHCTYCSFINQCFEENSIDISKKILSIQTLEEAIELSRKVMLADAFLKQVKEKIKGFMMEYGIDELKIDGRHRVYLSPSISLRFGKAR